MTEFWEDFDRLCDGGDLWDSHLLSKGERKKLLAADPTRDQPPFYMDPNPYPRFKAFVDKHYLPHFGGPALPREDPQRAIGCFIGSLAMWLEKYDTREVLKKQIAELRAVINTERTEVVSLAERLLIESVRLQKVEQYLMADEQQEHIAA